MITVESLTRKLALSVECAGIDVDLLRRAAGVVVQAFGEMAINPTVTVPSELERVRDEIRLRSEVLRAFPDDIGPTTIGGVEAGKQFSRFAALLRRERELMGEEWTTG